MVLAHLCGTRNSLWLPVIAASICEHLHRLLKLIVVRRRAMLILIKVGFELSQSLLLHSDVLPRFEQAFAEHQLLFL